MKQVFILFMTLLFSQSCSDKEKGGAETTTPVQTKVDPEADKIYCTACLTYTGQGLMRCEASCLTRVLEVRIPPSKRVCAIQTKIWSMDPEADAKYKFTVYSLKTNYYAAYTQVNIGAHHVVPGEANGDFYCYYVIQYEK